MSARFFILSLILVGLLALTGSLLLPIIGIFIIYSQGGEDERKSGETK